MMKSEDVTAIRMKHNLSAGQLGSAVGLSKVEASRVVRAWEQGERKGKPYLPNGTAEAALRYLDAILDVTNKATTAGGAVARLDEALPNDLRVQR